ncbi:unnamed protein product, partial [Iphiclides podalirius]
MEAPPAAAYATSDFPEAAEPSEEEKKEACAIGDGNTPETTLLSRMSTSSYSLSSELLASWQPYEPVSTRQVSAGIHRAR